MQSLRKEHDVTTNRTQPTPQEQYERTANEPPVDPRKPAPRTTPGSHSTGGAPDHRTPRDSDAPKE